MNIIQAQPLNNSCKIAIVVAEFNKHITEKLVKGAIERLQELGINERDITITWVPGAVEIPIVAQYCAKEEQFEAIICYGAIIQGETDHYQYVCEQVSNGCQDVALKYGIPVIFGILTCQTEQQALARTGGEHGHLGKEYAEFAIRMVSVLRQLVG